MADIVHWLRKLAALVEADHAPQHVVLHMRAGADEIERLRIRLEIDPSHPYDGIYARDETIRGLEKEIERLRAMNEALLAANRDVMLHWDVLKADYEKLLSVIPECRRAARAAWGSHGDAFITIALEEGRT